MTEGVVVCMTKRGMAFRYGERSRLVLGQEELNSYARSQHMVFGAANTSIHSRSFETSVEWYQLRALRPVFPWPGLLINWGAGSVRWRPQGGFVSDRHRADFDRVVERLFEALPEYFPRYDAAVRTGVVSPGWLVYPAVSWEPEHALPEDDHGPSQDGPFRGGSTKKRILADRRPPTQIVKRGLQWLVGRPLKSSPKEVRVTAERVFAEFYSGRVSSVPRATLRRATGGNVRTYVFGRAASLTLIEAKRCPVAKLLDQQLEAVAT